MTLLHDKSTQFPLQLFAEKIFSIKNRLNFTKKNN